MNQNYFLEARKNVRQNKMKHSPLRKKSKRPSATIKDQIQAILRQIVIIRDGGCVMRHYYPEVGRCGGFRKDGQIILQYDHLNTRARAVSFADPRFGICVCKRHHIFFKKQYPVIYEECALKAIGETRRKLLEKVRADRKPYKIDWRLELAGLKQQFTELKKLSP